MNVLILGANGQLARNTARVFLQDTQKYGTWRLRVDAEAIKAFAAAFDPQPFHLDDDAARASFFQGLSASGWHTAALTMRLLVDGDLKSHEPPGPGARGCARIKALVHMGAERVEDPPGAGAWPGSARTEATPSAILAIQRRPEAALDNYQLIR